MLPSPLAVIVPSVAVLFTPVNVTLALPVAVIEPSFDVAFTPER